MLVSLPMYRALCYADVFGFPLTIEEMQRFAVRTGTIITQQTIRQRTASRQGYYCLRGRESCIPKRIDCLPLVKQKLRLAFVTARIFGAMPTVSAVFVTGGLAVGNAKKEDDIDFLIITKSDWLWTTRFVLVILSKLLGRYTHKRVRREDTTSADTNTWCLNMWLDETALALPKDHRNLYTAHEVVQALCVLDKKHIADRFLTENSWAKKYMPMKKVQTRGHTTKKQKPRFFEHIAFLLQRKALGKVFPRYARAARFFPKETGTFVLRELNKRM